MWPTESAHFLGKFMIAPKSCKKSGVAGQSRRSSFIGDLIRWRSLWDCWNHEPSEGSPRKVELSAGELARPINAHRLKREIWIRKRQRHLVRSTLVIWRNDLSTIVMSVPQKSLIYWSNFAIHWEIWPRESTGAHCGKLSLASEEAGLANVFYVRTREKNGQES